MTPSPLAGVRVIEFSHMVMGPSCGMILGDLGAEVIKVEPQGAGDKTRHLPGSGMSLFATFNRNKKSVQADLEDPDDAAFVHELVDTADVVIENFRTGRLSASGFGYDDLRRSNPGLIYCSLKGFQPGPYGDRSALDEVVQMLGGLAYMTGPPGRPLRAGASVNDIMGGMFGVIGILAALREREDTGRGTEITSSLFENSVFLVGSHMVQAELSSRVVDPMPAREPAWAVYDLFISNNGDQIFLAVVSDTQFRSLCEEFELLDLLADSRMRTNSERVEHRAYLHDRIQTVLSDLHLEEIETRCHVAGLSYAKVNTPSDLLHDPHLMATGTLPPTLVPSAGPESSTAGDFRSAGSAARKEVHVPLLPLTIDGHLLPKRLDVPEPGQDTEDIRRRLGSAPKSDE